MRIFVYLLALMTGFTAVQSVAAKPTSTQALNVAQACSDITCQSAHDVVQNAAYPKSYSDVIILQHAPTYIVFISHSHTAPVFRGDRSRE